MARPATAIANRPWPNPDIRILRLPASKDSPQIVGRPAFKREIVSLRLGLVSLNRFDLFGLSHAGSVTGTGRVAQQKLADRQLRPADHDARRQPLGYLGRCLQGLALICVPRVPIGNTEN